MFQGVTALRDDGTMKPRDIDRLLRTCLLAAAVLLAGAANVQAQNAKDDEEDVAPDVKFFQGILHGLGLRKDGAGIEYRERSPLVVPSGRDLPPPETTSVEQNPAWPTDPDVKRAKELKAARKKPRIDVDEESRPMTPEQLRNPQAAARRGAGAPTTPPSTTDPTDKSSMSELGAKSFFNWNALWGQREEYGTFTREPARSALTDPPAGYRTPSPNQPYGVGKEKYVPQTQGPLDNENLRGLGR
jgi:hypothetical protein